MNSPNITHTLKEINIPELLLPFYETNNNRISRFFSDNIYSPSSIEKALEIEVIKQARRDYEDIIKERNPIPPDHVSVCFSYALANGEFSEDEISQIPFDHRNNVKSFMERYYKKDLLSILREKILNPSMESVTYISHPMCGMH